MDTIRFRIAGLVTSLVDPFLRYRFRYGFAGHCGLTVFSTPLENHLFPKRAAVPTFAGNGKALSILTSVAGGLAPI
jgi:hypothetical protein